VNLEDHHRQCLYYCHQTFSCSPNRKFFITALYNFRSLFFCMTLKANETLHYIATNCVFNAQASRNLARFMKFSPETLGFRNQFPSFVSFLADVYELRYSSKMTHFKNSMLEVCSILRSVHSLGICHRDVRFPNLCFKNIGGELKVILIDWSTAKPSIPISELSSIARDSYPQGSSCTASNKVFRQM
jgi:hypothetical protein